MAYVISELNLERQKLLGKVLAPVTDRLLSALQLRSGVRGLDLGCGMGETTRQLARTLDKPNEIVGLELNPDLVETARSKSRIFHFNAVIRTVGHMSAFQTCSAGFSPTHF